MTLLQLKYMIEIVDCGSISKAAEHLFITQPSLSKAISDLEKEMDIRIFYRNNRGVCLSDEGSKFLSYARQVVEQADLLESHYKHNESVKRVFSISAQHYAFVVNAFVALVKEYNKNKYEFTLRETKTNDIIEDVRTSKSELGVLFISDFNRQIVQRMLKTADLKFTSLFLASPHVFVSHKSPLATKTQVTLADLRDFPRLTYEQGVNNSFYFSEELHSTEVSPKSILVTDRATLFNLLIGLDGYTISSGILSCDLNGNDIVAIPLLSDEKMEIGYISQIDRPLSSISERYITYLQKSIQDYAP